MAPVLIVDDHSLLAGSLAMVLAAEGCAVRTLKATTVEQLQLELSERPPTVVLVLLISVSPLNCAEFTMRVT